MLALVALVSLKHTTIRTFLRVLLTLTGNSTGTYRTVRYRTVRFRPELFVTTNFPIENLRSYKYPLALIYYTCTRTYGMVRYGTLD